MATLKQLVDETTNIKNELRTCHANLKNNLIDKGVECRDTDKLLSLVCKVGEIELGKKWASGRVSYQSIKATTSFSISCDFVPSILFVKINSVTCGYDGTIVSNAWLSNLESSFTFYNKHYTSFQIRGKVDKVSNKGFTITIDSNYNSMLALVGYFDWYAFE